MVGELERDISGTEKQMAAGSEEQLSSVLTHMHSDLGALLRGRAQGAIVRARYNFLKDIDCPSSFFFNLEKKVEERNHMHCLQLPDGRLYYDWGDIREAVVGFY